MLRVSINKEVISQLISALIMCELRFDIIFLKNTNILYTNDSISGKIKRSLAFDINPHVYLLMYSKS